MRITIYLIVLLALNGFLNKGAGDEFLGSRDPYLWPFSVTSIWNMPIGSDAEYTPQPLDSDHVDGVMVVADIIIFTPEEEPMDVYGTEYRWGRRTILQTQPFQVCPGGYATTGVITRDGEAPALSRQEDVDIYGDGYYGAHGGSGLSAIGGAIRVGELAPGSGPIRHALKISIPCKQYLFYAHETENGYRWPARKRDSRAKTNYTGTEPEAKIGCLRAIPPEVDLESLGLETEPGRKIAWTLRNYGAYQVEEVPWARIMIVAEAGPAGNVVEEFKKDWGYDFITTDKEGNPWFRDLIRIMAHLQIVTNNGPERIGGGGEPLQPLAPPFEKVLAAIK